MNKKERLDFILKLLEQKETIKVSDILEVLKIDRTTVYRDFKELEKQNEIKEISKWIYTKKLHPIIYLKTPFFQRQKKSYNFDFLANYKPNETFLFTKEQLKTLENSISHLDTNTDFYINNKRLLEMTLIDLSLLPAILSEIPMIILIQKYLSNTTK